MLKNAYPEIDPIGPEYVASGVFVLCEHDETSYKHTNKIDDHIVALLPSLSHSDSEFLRLSEINPSLKDLADKCYFRINVEEKYNADFVLKIVDSEQMNVSNISKDNKTAALSELGKLGAEALHNAPGGSRDKAKQIRDIWATGKYSSRDRCAEEEYSALDMSYSAARKALRNTPDPKR